MRKRPILIPGDDDAPVGRILTRREVLALLGGSGAAAFLAACAPAGTAGASANPATSAPAIATVPASATTALPSCVVRPALTEGPYFVDEKLDRSDIRSDPTDNTVKPGATLALAINVSRVSGGQCAALPGAIMDLWHCDALGVYSDASDPSFNTKGKKFLRGYQTSDASGAVRFTTIYPGWYQGRAVHIHFKIRTTAAGRTSDFTSQFFFEESLSDKVFAQPPYSQKTGNRLKNDGDDIYRQSGGKTLLNVTQSGSGYAATFDIGLAI